MALIIKKNIIQLETMEAIFESPLTVSNLVNFGKNDGSSRWQINLQKKIK